MELICNKCNKEFKLHDFIFEIIKSIVTSEDYLETMPEEIIYRLCKECFEENSTVFEVMCESIYQR